MALYLLVGVPGSGKSYFAVRDIATRYYDKNGATFTRKKKYTQTPIFTNINGLRQNLPDLIDLTHTLNKYPPSVFFTLEHQKKLIAHFGAPPVYVVDESADYFPDNYKEPSVFQFFRQHRHIGVDIYLITQSIDDLPRQITRNREIALMAVPRTLRLGSIMRYNVLGGRYLTDVMETKNIHFSLDYANLYRSSSQKEASSITNPYFKYIVAVTLLFSFGCYRAVSLIRQPERLLGKNVKSSSSPPVQIGNLSSSQKPKIVEKIISHSRNPDTPSSPVAPAPLSAIRYQPTATVYSNGVYHYLDRSGTPHTLTKKQAASFYRDGLTIYLPYLHVPSPDKPPPREGAKMKEASI